MTKLKGVMKMSLFNTCHNDLGLAVANSLTAITAGGNKLKVQLIELGNVQEIHQQKK